MLEIFTIYEDMTLSLKGIILSELGNTGVVDPQHLGKETSLLSAFRSLLTYLDRDGEVLAYTVMSRAITRDWIDEGGTIYREYTPSPLVKSGSVRQEKTK